MASCAWIRKARAAILAAVEESGFQLNLNAKQLKQSHANSILVIVKGSGNILFAEMLEVIQTALHGTQYNVILGLCFLYSFACFSGFLDFV